MKFIVCLLFSFNGFAANVIKVAISSTPNNLVPFYSTDSNSQNINRLIHKSLIDFNEKMEFVCVACKNFSEKVINKKQIINFELKRDLKFTDGTPVTAYDVENSLKYFSKDEIIKSTFMGAFENVEKFEVYDKYNFSITYKNYSLENLSNLGLLKIIKLTKTPSDNLSTDDVIGIGDYKLIKNTPLQISIEPLNKKKPSFEFKVVKDETTLALKLLNNEVDLSVASISPRKINWIKENSKNLKTYELPSGNYMFLGLNQNRSQFKDINIRKALSYLIPRQDLLKYKLKGSVALSNGMFSTAFPKMHTDRLIDEYNPTIATQLLNKAGYKKNKNGWLEKDGREFEIDWKVSNNKSSIEMVEVIKYYFSKVGIRVNITVLEWGTYMSNFKSGKFDIVAGQWIGFNGPDMLRFVFHSENIPPKGGNRIRYSNSNFDKVIDLATQESNPDKSILLYKEAEKIVSDDYAYVNLWHPNVVWIGRNCLKNVEVESTGSFNQLPKMEIACE